MRITERYDAEMARAHRDGLNAMQFEILMAAAEDPSYAAISAKLSIPGGTVRSRLHRARVKLAKLRAAGSTP